MDGAVTWPVRLLALTVLGYAVMDGIFQGFSPPEVPIAVIKDQSVSVNLNSAEELQVIPGIGPVIADRIVDQRTVQPFTNLLDFETRVRGIGPTFMLNYGQWLTFHPVLPDRVASLQLPSTQPIGFP